MQFLNIKEKDITFIIPFKNGHTLLYTTFIHLFKHFKIDYEIESNPDKILNNVYIFVRNPIDRFFSSYNWLNLMKSLNPENLGTVIKNMDILKINNINSFIVNYRKFLNVCNDFHYLPQSTQIICKNRELIKDGIVNPNVDLLSLYETKFTNGFTIVKIEDIDKIIYDGLDLFRSSDSILKNKLNYTTFDMESKKFNFLDSFSEEFILIFVSMYCFYKNHYNKTHHKHTYFFDKITINEYDQVCEITQKECDFFKYDKKVINNDIFKKELI